MMANNVTFDMSGLDDLERALGQLDNVAQKKVLRKAARVGAKPVYDEALAGVRNKWGEKSGALHDSVKLRVSAPNNKKWADVIASVGVFRIRSLEPLADAWYPGGYIGAPTLAHFFEYGVQPHSLGKKSRAGSETRRGKDTGGSRHPGIPAKPVLRQSMDNNVEIVMTRTGNVLGSEIDRVLKK